MNRFCCLVTFWIGLLPGLCVRAAEPAGDLHYLGIALGASWPPLTRVSPQLGALAFNGEIWSALIGTHDGDSDQIHVLGRNSVPYKPYFLTNSAGRDALCLPIDGPPLLVEQNEVWYPARLVERAGADFKVHYLGYRNEEAVTAGRIKYPFAGKAR